MKTTNPGAISLLTFFAAQALYSHEAQAGKAICPSYTPETIVLELIEPNSKAVYLELQKFYSPIKSISASKFKETELWSECYLKAASCKHEFSQTKSLQPTQDVSRNIELAKQTKFTRNIVSCKDVPQSLVKPGIYSIQHTNLYQATPSLNAISLKTKSEIEISSDRKTLIHRIQQVGKNFDVIYHVVKSELEAPPTLDEHATLVARSRANEIRHCYNKSIDPYHHPAEDVRKTYKAIIAWVINDQGVAQQVKLKQLNIEGITPALKDQFETCVKNRIEKWPFKPSENGKTYAVETPFQL